VVSDGGRRADGSPGIGPSVAGPAQNSAGLKSSWITNALGVCRVIRKIWGERLEDIERITPPEEVPVKLRGYLIRPLSKQSETTTRKRFADFGLMVLVALTKALRDECLLCVFFVVYRPMKFRVLCVR